MEEEEKESVIEGKKVNDLMWEKEKRIKILILNIKDKKVEKWGELLRIEVKGNEVIKGNLKKKSEKDLCWKMR